MKGCREKEAKNEQERLREARVTDIEGATREVIPAPPILTSRNPDTLTLILT